MDDSDLTCLQACLGYCIFLPEITDEFSARAKQKLKEEGQLLLGISTAPPVNRPRHRLGISSAPDPPKRVRGSSYGLLKLPVELREIIYDETLGPYNESLEVLVGTKSTSRTWERDHFAEVSPKRLGRLSLLLTSRQLYALFSPSAMSRLSMRLLGQQ